MSFESGIPLANGMVDALHQQGLVGVEVQDYPAAMKAAFAEDPAGRGRFLRLLCYGKAAGPTNRALGYLTQHARINPFFTTNFDHLLEQALLAYGDRPVRVATLGAASLNALRSGNGESIRVIKLHGDAQYNMTAHVYDEMDYHHRWLGQRAQLAVTRGSGLLVMGFSGRDDAHRRQVLRTTTGPIYQFGHARPQDRVAHDFERLTTAKPAGHWPVARTPSSCRTFGEGSSSDKF